jgi:hypothetical protein
MAVQTFTDQFQASAWAQLIALHGESVSYTPDGGDAVTGIDAIVRYDEGPETPFDDGRGVVRRARVKMARSDWAAPAVRDVVTVAAVAYAIDEEPLATADGCWMLVCERVEVTAKHGPAYEIERG